MPQHASAKKVLDSTQSVCTGSIATEVKPLSLIAALRSTSNSGLLSRGAAAWIAVLLFIGILGVIIPLLLGGSGPRIGLRCVGRAGTPPGLVTFELRAPRGTRVCLTRIGSPERDPYEGRLKPEWGPDGSLDDRVLGGPCRFSVFAPTNYTTWKLQLWLAPPSTFRERLGMGWWVWRRGTPLRQAMTYLSRRRVNGAVETVLDSVWITNSADSLSREFQRGRGLLE